MYKVIAFLSLLLIVSAQTGNPNNWWAQGKSTILKSLSFPNTVGKDKHVLVQFFNAREPASQTAAPEWHKLAEMYMGGNKTREDAAIALIDGWTFNSISQKYGVKKFPEILLFRKGDAENFVRYEGELIADKLSEFLEEHAVEIAPDANNNNNDTPNTENVEVPPQDTQEGEAKEPEDADEGSQATTADAQLPKRPVKTPTPAKPAQETKAEPAKPQETKTETKTEEKSSETKSREVNIVMDPSSLQPQFEELKDQLKTVGDSVQNSFNDQTKKVEDLKTQVLTTKKELGDQLKKVDELKTQLEAARKDINALADLVKGHALRFDDVRKETVAQKVDLQNVVTGHVDKHLQEVKSAITQVKAKIFEPKTEEAKGMNPAIIFLLGSGIGVAAAMIFNSVTGKAKKRSFLD